MSRAYGRFPNQEAFDAYVKQQHATGRTDRSIAASAGVQPETVARSRRRQNLTTEHGPGSTTRRAWKQRGMHGLGAPR